MFYRILIFINGNDDQFHPPYWILMPSDLVTTTDRRGASCFARVFVFGKITSNKICLQ